MASYHHRCDKECPRLCLILSKESNESEQVDREINVAVKYHLPLFCLRKENIALSDALEYYLINIQHLDGFSTPSKQIIEKLAKEIIVALESVLESAIHLQPGDDLAEAVQSSPAGSTLRLHAGEYYLDKTLIVEKNLTISSAGDGRPRINCSSLKAVAMFTVANWTLIGLDFLHKGENPADVVQVNGKQITIKDCTFSGGVELYESRKDKVDGCGLWIDGNTSCQIDNCIFQNNSRGIAIHGMSIANLERNTCGKNFSVGIHFSDKTKGKVIGNNCSENSSCGLFINGYASPVLIDNTCNDNSGTGIVYTQNAEGLASSNHCLRNGFNGIEVSMNASPILEKNHCDENHFGIFFGDHAKGKADGNFCRRNLQGIIIQATAEPILINNICSANQYFGIRINGDANPQIGQNSLQGNGQGEFVRVP